MKPCGVPRCSIVKIEGGKMASRNAKGRMIYWKISYCKQLARCSTFSKLLFTWLIPNTDDLGRMEGDPEIIKGMVFPYDEKTTVKQIRDALRELSKENLIIWYQVDENYYIQFPNFSLYQTLRKDREYKSDYPEPNDIDMTCHDMTGLVGQNLREEKGREEEEKVSEVKENVPFSDIQEMFNRVCVSFPSIRTLSKGRKDKIKTRWGEIKTLETFEQLCKRMEESSFLKGKNNREWKATFDWLLENDNNWVKVIEGNYADKVDKLGGFNNGYAGSNGIPREETPRKPKIQVVNMFTEGGM